MKAFLSEVKKFIHDKIRQARGLLQAVEHRKELLRKFTDYIVRTQGAFLEKGKEFLKPLSMKDIASRIGVHPSTVSRLVSQKYIQTPEGIYELKDFFSPAFKFKNGAENLAVKNVKEMIKKFIDSENLQHPLSDDEINSLLQKEGVTLARRTIAKYRNQLKILPYYLRKR